MANEHFYEVNLEWKEDRIGWVTSPVLDEPIEVATPPEFPKGVEGIWSPEHLYAAAINSCYMTTFLAIAENSKVEFTDFSAKTVCKMEQVDGKYLITEAVIEPQVTLVNPDKDMNRMIRILDRTKRACLISNSMKTEITLKHNYEPVEA